MKIHRPITAASLAGLLTVFLTPALLVAAEESASPKTAAPASRLDQNALDQLKRMSLALGAAKAFTFQTNSTVEVPAKTGQFITLFATPEFALQLPNNLPVSPRAEVPNYDLFYNGQTD